MKQADIMALTGRSSRSYVVVVTKAVTLRYEEMFALWAHEALHLPELNRSLY